MIENLKGIFETVNFKEDTCIKLYDNDKYEDYPPHWHTPIEIIMPVLNWYRVEFDNHVFNLKEGDIAIICPGTIHTLYAPKYGQRIIFQLDYTLLHGLKEMEVVLSLFSPITIVTPEEYPDIHGDLCTLLQQIRNEYIEGAPLWEPSIYARFIDMFVLLGRNHTEDSKRFDVSNSKQREYSEKFINICEYINAHCTDPLTLDEISDLAGFSKYHFSRLFKQFTNVSFYKFINQKRIARAEQLLINPEYSVTEAALSSGFSSLSAFIRMFKQIKGCTPTEFRNMYSPENLD